MTKGTGFLLGLMKYSKAVVWLDKSVNILKPLTSTLQKGELHYISIRHFQKKPTPRNIVVHTGKDFKMASNVFGQLDVVHQLIH